MTWTTGRQVALVVTLRVLVLADGDNTEGWMGVDAESIVAGSWDGVDAGRQLALALTLTSRQPAMVLLGDGIWLVPLLVPKQATAGAGLAWR